jgi:hypothetical protein
MLADGTGAAAKKGLRHVPLAALVSSYTTCPCVRRAEEHSHRDDTYHLDPRRSDQHDPWRATALAWRTGGDGNGLVGALQPLNLLIKLGDARSRSGSQRAAECLLSSRDRPSFAAVAAAGMCQNLTLKY